MRVSCINKNTRGFIVGKKYEVMFEMKPIPTATITINNDKVETIRLEDFKRIFKSLLPSDDTVKEVSKRIEKDCYFFKDLFGHNLIKD
jgi:hypothetical protein